MKRREFLKSLAVLPLAPQLVASLGCVKKKVQLWINADLSLISFSTAVSMFLQELSNHAIEVTNRDFPENDFAIKLLIGNEMDNVEIARELEKKHGIKWELRNYKYVDEWHVIFDHPQYVGLYEVWSEGA